jgi:hypothetical protein
LENTWRHNRRKELSRFGVTAEIDVRTTVGGQDFKNAIAICNIKVVRRAQWAQVVWAIRLAMPDEHQTLWCWEGKRSERERIDHAKYRGVACRHEGEQKRGETKNYRISPNLSQRMAEVLPNPQVRFLDF